ncbi:fam-m protein [Plasmodium malariae]|uniref:Fam-m protein n=1 Tax=Plasmodium malariae TaxID=5858 RepID=A0A1D3JGX6_PLAMA|nr:fam-m protein [Plasmodium malariae]SBT85526.1 fam-m protein [Plasmodium malariae]
MEQKINSTLFFKISAFMILSWICHFYCDTRTNNKLLIEKWTPCRRLNTRCYRLLAKYKKNKDSNTLDLKEDKPFNGDRNKRKNKQSNRSPLNKAQYYTEIIDYDNGMFDGKHFHFEKKLIKKKDYDDLLEKKRRICDIALKKIKFRKYRFGVFIFFLFFLVGIGLPILQGLGYLKTAGESLKNALSLSSVWNAVETALGEAKVHFFLISFVTLIIILSVIVLVALYKILINNEKYKKIKLMADLNE